MVYLGIYPENPLCKLSKLAKDTEVILDFDPLFWRTVSRSHSIGLLM